MKKKGFTLIELIAVVAIMSILTVSIFDFESHEVQLYQYQKAQSELQFDAKLSVQQVAKDIEKARYNSLSVQTKFTNDDHSNDKFIGMTDILDSTIYKPLAYIEKFDGTSCLYAIKNTGDATNPKYQLVRIDLISNGFTIGDPINDTTIHYDSKDYLNSRYFTTEKRNAALRGQRSDQWIANQADIIYEDNGNYYFIWHSTDGIHYLSKLKEQSSYVTIDSTKTEKVIADNADIDNTSIVSVDGKDATDSSNNAYNVTISLKSDKYSINSMFTMCASKVKLGGETNDEK